METQPSRRLTTIDAMILVGVTALGLLRLSAAWPEAYEVFRRVDARHLLSDRFFSRNFSAWPQTGRMDSVGGSIRRMVEPIAMGVQPRPGFRKPDGSQSSYDEWLDNFGRARTNSWLGGRAVGFAAAGEAYILAFPLLLAWTIGLVILRSRRPRPAWPLLWRQPGWSGCVAALVALVVGLAEEELVGWPVPTAIVSGSVVVAWLVLGLTRKWSAEATWIDRAGRGVALAWIMLIPLYAVGFAYPLFL